VILGLSLVGYGYMQAELNKAWRTLPGAAVEGGTEAAQIEQPAAQPAEPAPPAPPAEPERPSGT
jgi:hypothetical protein